jgi:hypothetical protein
VSPEIRACAGAGKSRVTNAERVVLAIGVMSATNPSLKNCRLHTATKAPLAKVTASSNYIILFQYIE